MAESIQAEEVFSTPWFSLVAKSVAGASDPHYAISTDDYVTVVALNRDDRFVLVRQFRPAVEEYTLEFPAGHLDAGETPEASAGRELAEETGYRAGRLELLGCLHPDTGRLANRMWVFLARDLETPEASFQPEDGIEVSTCSRDELAEMIQTGQFVHALHLAALFLAVGKGVVRWCF